MTKNVSALVANFSFSMKRAKNFGGMVPWQWQITTVFHLRLVYNTYANLSLRASLLSRCCSVSLIHFHLQSVSNSLIKTKYEKVFNNLCRDQTTCSAKQNQLNNTSVSEFKSCWSHLRRAALRETRAETPCSAAVKRNLQDGFPQW